jgi:RNA polymerase sigma-70 factor (ECF subfamily)
MLNSNDLDFNTIKSLINKDQQTQTKVYNKYYKEFSAHLRKYTTDRNDIDEILAKAFLKIFDKTASFNFNGSFVGWMYIIVMRCGVDFVKAKKVYTNRFLFEEKDLAGPTRDYVTKDYVQQLNKAIQELPNNTKQVITLFGNGYNHLEIANKLGISEGTSKWHVHEARKKLKKYV